VQHKARQRKETGLGMEDLQLWANPCSTHWLTRNEQVGGSSPLVGTFFSSSMEFRIYNTCLQVSCCAYW